MAGRGRPALPVGSYGNIKTQHIGPSKYAARCRYRDRDGIVRPVVRYGQTKSDAEQRLKAHLAERQHAAAGSSITGDTTVGALADLWLASDEVQGRAVGTRETYRLVVKNQVKPQLSGIRVRELDVALINAAVKRVRDTSGPSAAKTMKTTLSGMCNLAVAHRALPTNPMRDAAKVRGKGERPVRRVLTPDELTGLSDALRADPRAVVPSKDNRGGLDLADLIDWLAGTGCRIGEALACREGINADGEPLLDLEAGTWEINATLIRVPGKGLMVQERTKSDAGWRRIALPWFCVEMVKQRRAQLKFRPNVPVVFPSPLAKALRDPRNTSRDWREWRTGTPWEPFNFHRFRSTVATRLLEAGVDAAKVADHMGHARPSMTLDFYAGRNVVVSDAATILGR